MLLKRYLLAIVFLPIILLGAEVSKKSTLVADKITGDKRYTYADGNVELTHLGVVYKANKLKYDRDLQILNIDGAVDALSTKDGTKLNILNLKIDKKFAYADEGFTLEQKGVIYKADKAKYNHESKILYASGNVTAIETKTGYKLTAKSLKIDEKYLYADDAVTLKYKGVYYKADHVKYELATKKIYVNGHVEGIDSKTKGTLKANEVRADDDYIYADGNISIVHEGITYKAEHSKYDRKNNVLNVWDDIAITDKKNGALTAKSARIDVKNKGAEFNDFLFEGDQNQWVSSPRAVKENECYNIIEANYSSCDKEDPDWHIEFKRAEYNDTSKYVKLKHAVFYVKKLPILYFPYMAFPVISERSTGFLMPRLGKTSRGGYLYDQPFFWAINDSLDIEFNPQVRHKRGVGMYATARFVDSQYSRGGIRVGYFRDFDSFTKEYDVDKNIYQGMEIRYESDNVLRGWLPNGLKDMLYVNLQDYNDIDYINLQKDELMHHEYSKYRESRVNYMLYNNNYFYGVGARRFKLTSDESNDHVIQMEPAAVFHKYTKEIGASNVTYAIDANIFNHVRKKGSEALVVDFNMPFEYRNSLFGDYFKFKITEEFHAYRADFDNIDAQEADSIQDASLTSKLKLYSDISRAYGSAMHTMQFYTQYSNQQHTPDYIDEYNALDKDIQDNFITYKPYDDKINIGFSQYYYGQDKSLKFKQRISQSYYPDDEQKRGLLRHELMFAHKKWRFYDISEYSWEYGFLGKTRNYIKYSGEKLSWILGHDWVKNLPNEVVTKNQLDVGFTYKYNERLNLFASTTYDLRKEKDYALEYKAGFIYDKGCWNTKFTYARESEYVGGELEHDDRFEVLINLIPLGGFSIR